MSSKPIKLYTIFRRSLCTPTVRDKRLVCFFGQDLGQDLLRITLLITCRLSYICDTKL
jgi:hypothetical protein